MCVCKRTTNFIRCLRVCVCACVCADNAHKDEIEAAFVLGADRGSSAASTTMDT